MTSPSNANTQEEIEYILENHNIHQRNGYAKYGAIYDIERLFKRKQAKDLQKISFHFAIPVKDLEKALEAKEYEDENRH